MLFEIKLFQPSIFTVAVISDGKGTRRVVESGGLEERTEVAGEKPRSVTLLTDSMELNPS
jgi:hypothetical protein